MILKDEYAKNVGEVKKVSGRVMNVKLDIEGVMMNVVSGSSPQVGCNMEEKEKFCGSLNEVGESIPRVERVAVAIGGCEIVRGEVWPDSIR